MVMILFDLCLPMIKSYQTARSGESDSTSSLMMQDCRLPRRELVVSSVSVPLRLPRWSHLPVVAGYCEQVWCQDFQHLVEHCWGICPCKRPTDICSRVPHMSSDAAQNFTVSPSVPLSPLLTFGCIICLEKHSQGQCTMQKCRYSCAFGGAFDDLLSDDTCESPS